MFLCPFRRKPPTIRNDAIDFVAWYNATSTRISNIASSNARNLYLAYHEGNGGFQRATYRNKEWLLDAANRVQVNSERFSNQQVPVDASLIKIGFNGSFPSKLRFAEAV